MSKKLTELKTACSKYEKGGMIDIGTVILEA